MGAWVLGSGKRRRVGGGVEGREGKDGREREGEGEVGMIRVRQPFLAAPR